MRDWPSTSSVSMSKAISSAPSGTRTTTSPLRQTSSLTRGSDMAIEGNLSFGLTIFPSPRKRTLM